MVELFESSVPYQNQPSSKGNQLKWRNDDMWYKADYTGYEGLSEYVVSRLLSYSNLESTEYVEYDTETIRYKNVVYTGCKSRNFLPEGWMLITLERLFQQEYGQSLSKAIYSMDNYENRIRFVVEQTIRVTGLKEFGNYLCKLLTIDALFLNEDRHMHNIAVLMDEERNYHYCPMFDHGASLLADTTMDYPLGGETELLINSVEAKTFCRDFDEQLDIAERLYGKSFGFHFGRREIEDILEQESYYSEEEKQRVLEIVMGQRRKYQYLF